MSGLKIKGFKVIRSLIIEKIRSNQVQHELRKDSYEKNLYAHGIVSSEEVVALLCACRGDDYKVEPLHADKKIDVHFFKPVKGTEKWYIKVYLLEPDAWFISVHK